MDSDVRPAAERSTLAVARLVVLVVTVVAIAVAFVFTGTDGIRDLLTDVGESRWGLVAFVLAYAVGVVMLLPGTLGTLTAGAVFGFPVGAFASLTGATIGATVAFFISRAMGREGAQQLFGHRLTEVDEFIGRNDFVSMLVLRLMPIVPFNLLNYGSGLAAIRPSRYVAATALGMLPGSLLTTAWADQANDPTGIPFMILSVIFVVVLVGSIMISKRLREKQAASV